MRCDDKALALTGPLAALIGWSQRTKPALIVTCARGSSAHAATICQATCLNATLGSRLPLRPSNVATIYRQRLQLKNQLLLAISQSGRSDDLTEFALMAKAGGAFTAAIVNDTDSPLAAACDIVLPTAAGPELSVAATKSFVASLAMLVASDHGMEGRRRPARRDRAPSGKAGARDRRSSGMKR